jgi:uncharacterized UBP type Zn finger protein
MPYIASYSAKQPVRACVVIPDLVSDSVFRDGSSSCVQTEGLERSINVCLDVYLGVC